MIKITALIITLNEEKHIGACIDSLAAVADEVWVIDSFSADKTKAVAESKGAKVIELNFAGFGPQRNMGAAYASDDWILVLDADERLSPELKNSISALKNTNPTAAAYTFNRLNFIGKRAIKSGGWYPDRHTRLYDKNKARWNDREVHEEIMVHGETAFLAGDLLHYSYDDMAQLKDKSTRYARLGAEVYRGKNKLVLFVQMILSPVAKFFKTYFLQLGFTDGYIGFLASYYRAREAFLKYYLAL
jgi:glycosyltransferase involved in cell wall biosynthesis